MSDHIHTWRKFYLVPSSDPLRVEERVYATTEPDVAYGSGFDCECGARAFATERTKPVGSQRGGAS